MQVYGKAKGWKIFLLCNSLFLSVVMAWCILYAENPLTFALGLGMFIFAILAGVTTFADKLILGEDFIEAKGLLKRKRIFFKEIDSIIVYTNQAFVKSEKAKIHISRDIENFRKVIGLMLLKVENNERVTVGGNPFAISCHIAEADGRAESQVEDKDVRVSPVLVRAELVKKGWLYRSIRLNTTNGSHEVMYYGRGEGCECVLVDGEVVAKKKSVLWYAPEFRFRVGSMEVVVNVRVWPWFMIRKFWIEVNGKKVYAEGLSGGAI